MTWQPAPSDPQPQPVRDSLERVLDHLGMPTPSGVEVIFDRWCEVVGDAMGACSRPLAIDGSTLVVGCDDPALATHIRFLEPQLVRRLVELTGNHRISGVEVRVNRPGRVGRPVPPRSRRPARRR